LDSEQVAQSLQTQTQPPVTANTQRISPDRLSARQVRQIQQALDNMGFKAGWIDGKWGPKTEAALKSFQRSRNIASNGQLDQTTVAALGLNAADFGLTGSDATNGQTPIDVG
jgi:peptidoglycan hydrolase-like protein with peptidoglycan-binding domain